MTADEALSAIRDHAAADPPSPALTAEVFFGTENVVSGGSTTLVEVTGTRDFTLANDISQRIGDWAEDQWEAALEIAIESSIA